MRSVFIAATLFWNIAAVAIGTLMGLYAISYPPSGLLSLLFAGVTGVQGILAFFKLKQSLTRYIRFGLTSAAFSRTPSKLAIAWIVATLIQGGVFIGALISFISLSSSTDPAEAKSGRLGVVWFAILGATMGSLILGMCVVSRISPYLSSLFVQTPYVPQEDIDLDRQ